MREQPKDRERLAYILDAVDTILNRCEGMTREGLTADKICKITGLPREEIEGL